MKAFNLIPIHRRVARQRATHVRRCIRICVACGVMSTLACVGTFAFSSGDDATLQARLDRADNDLAAATRSAEVAASELVGVESTLRATRAIADQPDWGLLLALLSKTTGPEVVLKAYEITPIEPAVVIVDPAAAAKEAAAKAAGPGRRPAKVLPKVPEAPKVRYTLTLAGVGRSQYAVTQFVLRLEQTGLFDAVKLLDTSRQSVNNVESTGFRIECAFGGGGNGGNAAPASTIGGTK